MGICGSTVNINFQGLPLTSSIQYPPLQTKRLDWTKVFEYICTLPTHPYVVYSIIFLFFLFLISNGDIPVALKVVAYILPMKCWTNHITRLVVVDRQGNLLGTVVNTSVPSSPSTLVAS